MEHTVQTSRLCLTLITKAERESQELGWLHEYRSNEQATWWSLLPRSKTLEDTEQGIKYFMPLDPPVEQSRRIAYAVHEKGEASTSDTCGKFIGLITLKSLDASDLVLPSSLGLPALDAAATVTVELAYGFLPAAWGKGYATESISAALDACKRATNFWVPYEKVYVRVIVNGENPPSLRVMAKVLGMEKKGIFEVERKVWLAGQWREHHELHIFGMELLG